MFGVFFFADRAHLVWKQHFNNLSRLRAFGCFSLDNPLSSAIDGKRDEKASVGSVMRKRGARAADDEDSGESCSVMNLFYSG